MELSIGLIPQSLMPLHNPKDEVEPFNWSAANKEPIG